MKTFITSDAHVGSPYARTQDFMAFLRYARDTADQLVLNGDILSIASTDNSEEQKQVLDRLKRLSNFINIVWLQGNHEPDPRNWRSPPPVVYRKQYTLLSGGKRILVVHGDEFEHILSRHHLLSNAFRLLYGITRKLGGKQVHLAEFAKKLPFLYVPLCHHVRRNAVKYAREQHIDTIVCGHVHFAENTLCSDVRYVNSGSWTGDEVFFVEINGEDVCLHRWEMSTQKGVLRD